MSPSGSCDDLATKASRAEVIELEKRVQALEAWPLRGMNSGIYLRVRRDDGFASVPIEELGPDELTALMEWRTTEDLVRWITVLTATIGGLMIAIRNMPGADGEPATAATPDLRG